MSEDKKILQGKLMNTHRLILNEVSEIRAASTEATLEEDRKRMGLPIEESENVNDWMARFTKKSEPKVIIESQTIDSEGFAKGFTKKSEEKVTNNKLGSSKFLIEKASESLDKAMIDDTLDDIVELAENLTEDRSIHPSNLLLEEQDFESRISNLRKNKKSNNED